MPELDPDDYGDHVEQGQWERAAAALTVAIRRDPTDSSNYFNRGTCLLAMRQLQDALRDLQKGQELSPDNDLYPAFIGIILWWLGRPPAAVEVWQSSLTAPYTDAAGGVEIPALLLFAASRLADPALEKEALSLLRQRWKPALNKIWPGPIAGYLLGKVSGKAFLVTQTFADPILESRRLCKAHFWVAVKRYRQQKQEGYLRHLRLAIQDPPPGHRLAVTLEQEYWLAHAELELQSEGK